MFEKSDKYFFAARITLNVLHILGMLLFLVVPILVAIFESDTSCLIYLVGVPATALSWLLTTVLFGVICDIKLIRNKLYCEDTRALAKICAGAEAFKNMARERIVRAEKGAELKELIAMLDSGEISREEYAERVSELWKPIDEVRLAKEQEIARKQAEEKARAAKQAKQEEVAAIVSEAQQTLKAQEGEEKAESAESAKAESEESEEKAEGAKKSEEGAEKAPEEDPQKGEEQKVTSENRADAEASAFCIQSLDLKSW